MDQKDTNAAEIISGLTPDTLRHIITIVAQDNVRLRADLAEATAQAELYKGRHENMENLRDHEQEKRQELQREVYDLRSENRSLRATLKGLGGKRKPSKRGMDLLAEINAEKPADAEGGA
jgi:uncharacterized protein YlxW (UPF0749 family)